MLRNFFNRCISWVLTIAYGLFVNILFYVRPQLVDRYNNYLKRRHSKTIKKYGIRLRNSWFFWFHTFENNNTPLTKFFDFSIFTLMLFLVMYAFSLIVLCGEKVVIFESLTKIILFFLWLSIKTILYILIYPNSILYENFNEFILFIEKYIQCFESTVWFDPKFCIDSIIAFFLIQRLLYLVIHGLEDILKPTFYKYQSHTYGILFVSCLFLFSILFASFSITIIFNTNDISTIINYWESSLSFFFKILKISIFLVMLWLLVLWIALVDDADRLIDLFFSQIDDMKITNAQVISYLGQYFPDNCYLAIFVLCFIFLFFYILFMFAVYNYVKYNFLIIMYYIYKKWYFLAFIEFISLVILLIILLVMYTFCVVVIVQMVILFCQ